ncbi:MAG: class I SAM-dependent methyltransferase [Pseudomonadota bacterium]|nr:class I SAM-dependent methyltransferase [Pseudomonadota bacterium]
MKRIPEPELMLSDAQAQAYAYADFEAPHAMFIDLFKRYFPNEAIAGQVVDLGCGPADISRRFAQAFPACHIDAVDASEVMLAYGQGIIAEYGLSQRIRLIQGYLPGVQLPQQHYDIVIANSLLHHLADPQVLWHTVKALAQPQAPVFIMDLVRPETRRQAEIMLQRYAEHEPQILRQDFFNSLLAAYRIDEIQEQIEQAGLEELTVHEVSDRHFIVVGRG